MRSVATSHSSYPQRASLRRRAMSLILAIVANALILIMLLRLAPYSAPRPPEAPPAPIMFQLTPDQGKAAPRARTTVKVRRAGGGAPRARQAAPVAPPKSAPVPQTAELNVLHVGKDVLQALDIALASPHRSERAPGGGGTSSGQDAGVAEGPGETGPGGQRLYDAQWYRRPTNAELAYYLPAGAPRIGWGLIACRTVAQYRVEDCAEIGESPAGSGLARAVRQAAWQFKVLPPRIGGHAEIGAWVRIRIDYSESGASLSR